MSRTPFAAPAAAAPVSSPAASPDTLSAISADGSADSSPVVRSIAARLSGGLFLAAAGFQVALAAGAPWGAAAWGGANSGVLPMGYRVASVGSAAVLAGLGVALSGGVSAPRSRRRLLIGALGFATLSAVMNLASPSGIERAIWVPFAAVQIATLLWARRVEAAAAPLRAA